MSTHAHLLAIPEDADQLASFMGHVGWFDRSREYAARRRREHYGRYQYATEETVALDPPPCWRHLPIEEVRRHVKDLIRDIESEAAAKRRATGKPGSPKAPSPRVSLSFRFRAGSRLDGGHGRRLNRPPTD